MAKRYSGDVEVRIEHEGSRRYVATVRAPDERGRAIVNDRGASGDPSSPEAYDRVARLVLAKADEAAGGTLPLERDGRGRPLIRRTYQSPCPVPTSSGFSRVARRPDSVGVHRRSRRKPR